MNGLNRIFISIKSQIDRVVGEFENHEALAAVALEELQEVARKTRLHLHRVGKMSEQYAKQLQEQQEQARLWSKRAVKIRPDDGAKALQCVRRLRQAQRHIATLEQQYRESTEQEAQLRDDLNAIQEQLLILNNKKEILSARQNRAAIRDTLLNNRGNPMNQAHSIFERWEGAVVSEAFSLPEINDSDSLADSFEREEDELILQKMLDELTRSTLSDTDS